MFSSSSAFVCLPVSLSCFLISSHFFLLPFSLLLSPPFPSPLSANRKIWEEKSDKYTCLPWCLTQTPRLPIYSLLYAEELAQTRQLWSCKLKARMITLEQHECSRGWHFHSIAWLNTAVLLKRNHNFFFCLSHIIDVTVGFPFLWQYIFWSLWFSWFQLLF